ncbi:Sad1-interacting factor 3 [Sporothrix curviconia]|uniref:Sad1-interacting factor 3 n=1 Tax=Sporothrix curviconia TaxID=1260050 RepID=A0ABP0BQ04_9PEZI
MSSKRGPSVLVTDARERPPNRGSPNRRPSSSSSLSSSQDAGSRSTAGAAASASSSSPRNRLPMRYISVDNVLQNNSEIPSGQPRGPPGPLRILPSAALSAAASVTRRRGLTRRGSSSFGINAGGAGAGSSAAGSGMSSGVLVPGSLSGGVGGVGGGVHPGGGPPLTRGGLPGVPSRTTKISEKLVLLPETADEKAKSDEDEDDEDVAEMSDVAWAASVAGDENAEAARRALQRAREALEDAAETGAVGGSRGTHAPGSSLYDGARPPRDEELDVLRKRGGIRGKSYAERLPKGQRTEKVARLTAYCTAQAFKMRATAEFLRTHHAAKTKLYDDCLYTVYHLPLLPGHDGFRVRSRPMLKTPGTGKTVLDLEIERSERRDEHMGYYDEYASQRGDRRGNDGDGNGSGNINGNSNGSGNSNGNDIHQQMNGVGNDVDGSQRRSGQDRSSPNEQLHGQQQQHGEEPQQPRQNLYALSPSPGGNESPMASIAPPVNRLAPEAKHFAEMFVFSYGVVVFWNFTEYQEKDILADLAFAEDDASTSTAPAARSLVTRPLDEADFETEEFHFEYSANVQRPRVFNDMITLLPRSDHMVKLTISHAIAQSTKLCFFEEKMSETMQGAQHVPKRLALTGELNMSRTEIVKILGNLFKNRVDINLSSNILDVPNFFWDAEPTLHPLYVAIREYLEIDQRIQVLNERCRVFLDLAEILADSVADAKMSYITWIVIILIVVSILVTVTEVTLRFAILEKEKGKYNGTSAAVHPASSGPQLLLGSSSPPVAQIHPAASDGSDLTLEELRAWAAQLDARERAAVCGSDFVGQTFAGV